MCVSEKQWYELFIECEIQIQLFLVRKQHIFQFLRSKIFYNKHAFSVYSLYIYIYLTCKISQSCNTKYNWVIETNVGGESWIKIFHKIIKYNYI